MEGFGFLFVLTLILVCFPEDVKCKGQFISSVKCPQGSSVEKLAKVKGLVGAWSEMDKKDMDPVVLLMAQSSLNGLNPGDNIQLQDISKSDILNVYQQLVNGVNYCIKFRAVSSHCEPNKVCTRKEYVCEVGGYKPFDYGLLLQGAPASFEYGKPTCAEKDE